MKKDQIKHMLNHMAATSAMKLGRIRRIESELHGDSIRLILDFHLDIPKEEDVLKKLEDDVTKFAHIREEGVETRGN